MAAKKETTPLRITMGDRVAMVSLRADGSPDQVDHVVIGGDECEADALARLGHHQGILMQAADSGTPTGPSQRFGRCNT